MTTYTIQEAFQIINDYDGRTELPLEEIKHDSVLLKYLRIAMGVDYTFSPDLGHGYPEGVFLNRDFPDGISDSALRYEHRGFYLYEARHTIDAKKRLKLFGDMLSSIHYKEADLMIDLIDGKFHERYPNITYEVCNRVYPHLFPLDNPTEKAAPAAVVPKTPVTAQEVETKLADAFTNLPPPKDTTRDAFSLDTNERPLTTVKPAPVVEAKPEPKPVVKKVPKVDKRSKEYRLRSGRDKE